MDNPFEGMSADEVRYLSLQAQLVRLTAKTAVLEALLIQTVLPLLKVTAVEGMPIGDLVPLKTKEAIAALLPTLSDRDPNWTTKIVKMLEAVERGHV